MYAIWLLFVGAYPIVASSCARAQDYIKIFMRSNALLNGRPRVTMSDLYLYDLVHPLFLNSIGELGTENLVLSLFRKHPDLTDKERMKKGAFRKEASTSTRRSFRERA